MDEKKKAIYAIGCFTILSSLLTFSTVSSANETYDISELEYAGVRLGFTPEETMEALSKSLDIDPDAFTTKRWKFNVAGLEISEAEEISMLYDEGDMTVEARFYPDVRQSPVPEAALTRLVVTRGIEGGGTHLSDASVILDEMIADVTNKVGPASASKPFSYWCVALNSEGVGCVDETPRLTLSLATIPRKIGGNASLAHYAVEDMVRGAREE